MAQPIIVVWCQVFSWLSVWLYFSVSQSSLQLAWSVYLNRKLRVSGP